jgi:hypothetical protein
MVDIALVLHLLDSNSHNRHNITSLHKHRPPAAYINLPNWNLTTNSGGSLVVKTLHQYVLQTQARYVTTIHCETHVRSFSGAPKR